MTSTPRPAIRIGADVGGTFTDVVVVDGQSRIWTHKIPSTPPDFEQAVLGAVARLLDEAAAPGSAVAEVVHGTTVATNAVLERRGARTALVTTSGFRDVLELRRIRAPQMYDLFFEKPAPLVDRQLRFELAERIAADGEVLLPIDMAELWALKAALEQAQVESIAVCLLHSYAFPQHEIAVGDFLRAHMPGVQISLSFEVLRERKEYERSATTVVNAYVRPVMRRYLDAMRGGLRALDVTAPLLIMQSAGGLAPEQDAGLRPVYVLESGPAAGVLAAAHAARRLGIANALSLDIGGTTAKASLIEGGQVAYSPEYEVGASVSSGNRLVGGGGELIRAPSIDIAEVGAGGGSIAYLDRVGGLHVGPRSAGALPGPACYGRGGVEPTLTDANVVLGYIRPGRLAGGDVIVDLAAARQAVAERVAAPLAIELLAAAEGIHRIANARMMRALRAVSTERGRDPRDFTLIAFGGSGPIHAAGLARELLIDRVIVPPLPGLLSALGLLLAGVEHHDVRSCQLAGERLNTAVIELVRSDVRDRMLAQFAGEGYAAGQVRLAWSVDMRFRGQASEIRIPLPGTRLSQVDLQALHAAFVIEHERLYGHRSDPDNPVEVVAVRLIGQAETHAQLATLAPVERAGATAHCRQAYFGARWGAIETPVIDRRALVGSVAGPLLIDEYDSTTVVPPDARASLDEQGNIVIDLSGAV
jgi:N-methylhydantoinase A